MNRPPPNLQVSRRSGGRWGRSLSVLIIAVTPCAPVLAEPATEAATTLARRFRRPTALALSSDGSRLYVANERSGSLSVVDPDLGKVIAEHDLGRGLSDVVLAGEGPEPRLLVVDRVANTLLLVEPGAGGERVEILGRLAVAADPATVVAAPDARSCVVASTWSRRLTFVAIERDDSRAKPGCSLVEVGTVDLPFSPRNLALAPSGTKLIVADAFGGKVAVVDRGRRTLESVRSFPAHNIRGLAVTPDGENLVLVHQILHRLARTDFEDVHWGRLLTSHVRTVPLGPFLGEATAADLIRKGSLISLGAPTMGAADPSGLVCDASGVVAVAVAGVGEVAVGSHPAGGFVRYEAGRRPSAVAARRDGAVVYVADAIGDAITVVEVQGGRRRRVIGLGPVPEPSLVDRGERLFSDARLSHEGWMSCQSCHTDGQSNGQLGDTLGDGSYGAPKRVPSLLGTGTTGPWSWTGGIDRLEDQVRKSIALTMRGRTPTDEQVDALTAYLRTLAPPPPSRADGREAAAERGRVVFRSQGCAGCHAPPHYTTPKRYDVGLADEAGHRAFNPPSLLGVGRREPLLHDGRAATLEDVFREHRHPDGLELDRGDINDLVAFLGTL